MRIGAALVAALVAVPVTSWAQSSVDPAPTPTDTSWFGDYRARGVSVSSYPVDAAGTTLGQSTWIEHRFHAGAYAKNGPVSITADADFANGLLVGDTSDRFPFVAYRRDVYSLEQPNVYLRNLFVEAKLPVALLRAGHMGSKWGLGIVANDGTGTPDWGDHYFGDEVERVVAATRPLSRISPALAPLVAALGADVVYKDQTADLFRGDRAYQGVGSLVWAPEGKQSRIGAYVVRRSQVDRDGYDLKAWVLDAHARWVGAVGPVGFQLEGEVVREYGTTDEVRDIYDNSRTIDQMGIASEIGLGFGAMGDDVERHRVELVTQLGYASGDDTLHDGKLQGFKFDPEYNVGVVLFKEVLAWQSAATARSVADPSVFGRPAPGARFLPTDGAVTNARYLMPTVRWSVNRLFSLRAGWLMAQADRPLLDPYQTEAVNGGVRHSALGSTTSSLDLGNEIDVGARYVWITQRAPHLTIDVQGGHLMPGAALVDASGTRMKNVDRILAGLSLAW